MTHHIDLSQTTHLIFDWDGTLMDSAHKIVSCMQQAAILSDLPMPSAHDVHQIIGISLVPAIERLFGVNKRKAEEVTVHYKEVFMEQDQTACELFDGAFATLQALSKNFTLGVATGKARRGLERAFESSSSKHFFTDSMTADDAESKPSSQMLENLMEKWNIQANNAIMIGDTHYDMQMAEQIGMPRIGVSFGVHTPEQLLQHQPLAIVDHISDLLELLTHKQ